MNNAAKWKEFVKWWEEYRKKSFPGQAVIVRMDVDLEIKELQKGDNAKQIQLEEVESEASIIDDTEITDGQGF